MPLAPVNKPVTLEVMGSKPIRFARIASLMKLRRPSGGYETLLTTDTGNLPPVSGIGPGP